MTDSAQPVENQAFQAEIGRLLHILSHSLYSDREIFLRELLSNAADACDKLRHLALTEQEILGQDRDFGVLLLPDKAEHKLIIEDNGIGMSRQELVTNLGTIARSGTRAFLDSVEKDSETLIGRFGVGFYAVFMVAERVEVASRKAGEDEAWVWASDGQGEFSLREATPQDLPKGRRGTRISLSLKKDAIEFLEAERLRTIVCRYSDHLDLPVRIGGAAATPVNTASALWRRPKSDVTQNSSSELFRHITGSLDTPWAYAHIQAEGRMSYSALLFIPNEHSQGLFDPREDPRLRLYVKRVFVTDECRDLLPSWLRFLAGVVDSDDLPLNISREALQTNPLIPRIREALIKRILDLLDDRAQQDPESYLTFWARLGSILKEGLCDNTAHRARILELARFSSTAGEDLTSLADYVARMKPGQKVIHTISGDSLPTLRTSPQIEGFLAHNLEVLLLTDPVDAFWLSMIDSYRDHPFESVTRASTSPEDESKSQDHQSSDITKDSGPLLAWLRIVLRDAVRDVRASTRLTESAVCLVAEAGDPDLALDRMLRRHNNSKAIPARILEVNPTHPLTNALVIHLREDQSTQGLEDMAWLLLDLALIMEGEPAREPASFARRLTTALIHSLNRKDPV